MRSLLAVCIIFLPYVMGWTVAYKETLRAAGAMDVVRPINIKAEKLPFPPHGIETDTDCKPESNDNKHEKLITRKIIHFQRHGQGYHNLLGDITKEYGRSFDIDDPDPSVNPFVRLEIQDSPLTYLGRREAASQQSQVSLLNPQVVIISPLHRAIETALISFDHHHKKGIPFIAHEGCREQLGLLTCNKALPLSQTKVDFPIVDFNFVTHGEEDKNLRGSA